MRQRILTTLTIILMAVGVRAQAIMPWDVRFGNEAADTTAITDMLVRWASMRTSDAQSRVIDIARSFIDTPYGAGTIEGVPEMLTVRIDSLDCTTFVETVLALALTVDERRTSWRDFVYNLAKIRYRSGTPDGYGSRLHYFSDWVVDNTHRGVLREMTRDVAFAVSQNKTLDYMSTHRNLYPAMADEGAYQGIKNAEVGYRNHRYDYIRPSAANSQNLRNGDVVAFVSKTPGLDVSHMGFVVMEGGKPYLLHASSRAGSVTVERHDLAEYLRRNRSLAGIRVVRLR